MVVGPVRDLPMMVVVVLGEPGFWLRGGWLLDLGATGAVLSSDWFGLLVAGCHDEANGRPVFLRHAVCWGWRSTLLVLGGAGHGGSGVDRFAGLGSSTAVARGG